MVMEFAGQMNARIGLYKPGTGKNAGGEVDDTPTLIASRFAYRDDAQGAEVADGKQIGTFRRDYHLRFDPTIYADANGMYIVDFDGEWDVVNVTMTGSRQRYMILKCNKRGQDFTV